MRIKKLQRGNIAHIIHVVEPPNNGHVGDECFVHYSAFVPSSEGSNMHTVIGRGHTVCPL